MAGIGFTLDFERPNVEDDDMHSLHRFLLACCVSILCSACGNGTPIAPPIEEPIPHFDYPLDDTLRMHHVQTKGTHNSYHVINPELSDPNDRGVTHSALDVQLGVEGVRQLEIDIRRDMDTGDFKVGHVPLLDEGTTCPTLSGCLQIIKDWSDAHRAHHAITVMLDIKDAVVAPEEMETYFGELHGIIGKVWPAQRIVTPDEVQGDFATLGEAVKTDGWPVLGQLRGRIIFLMYSIAFGKAYSREGTSLSGRMIFTRAELSDPTLAWALYDNSEVNAGAVANAVAANLLVRTRADVDLAQPDPMLRDTALASGSHFVVTDFPMQIDGVDYWVDIPGGAPSRCNPVTAPPECTSEAIEDPAFVGP